MILDTFVLLFKSDSSQASKDIGELDKKIETLTERGKKRTEQENKDLKELNKQRKEQNETLKETDSQFRNITENILAAATAAYSFSALKKDFFGAVENNSALAIQGKLLGQSAQDIKAYGYAFESAGGDSETFRQQIQKTSDSIFAISGHLPKVAEVVAKLREATREGREEAIATGDTSRFNRQAELAGILPSARSFFLLSDEASAKSIDKFQKLTSNTAQATEPSRDFAQAMVTLTASFDRFLSVLEIQLLPILTKLVDELSLTLGADEKSMFNKVLSGSAYAEFLGLEPKDFFDSRTDYAGYRRKNKKLKTNQYVPDDKEEYIGTNDKLFDSDKPTQSELVYQKLVALHPELGSAIMKGKASLSVADTTPFGASAINNTATQNSKQFNIKTGDIHVNTNADNVTGIASGIANELAIHFRAAAANLDNGVAY